MFRFTLFYLFITGLICGRYVVTGTTPYPTDWEHLATGKHNTHDELKHSRNFDVFYALNPLNKQHNDAIKQGKIELWNPHLFCGYPTSNNTMMEAVYPPQIILHYLFSNETAYLLFLWIHLFLGMIFMHLLLSKFKLDHWICFIGSLTWSLCSYNGTFFAWMHIPATSCLFPLTFYLILCALETSSRKTLLLAALVNGLLIIASHPQMSLLVNIFLVVYLAIKKLSYAGLYFLISVLVSSITTLPFIESMLNSSRDIQGTSSNILNPFGVLITMFFPRIVPSPSDSLPIDTLPMILNFRNNFLEYRSYFGLAAILITLFMLKKLQNLKFFYLFAGFCLLMCILEPVISRTPIANYLFAPRWLYIFSFCATILFAHAISKFITDLPDTKKLRFFITIIALLFAIILIATVVFHSAGLMNLEYAKSKGKIAQALRHFLVIFDYSQNSILMHFAIAVISVCCILWSIKKSWLKQVIAVCVIVDLLPLFLSYNPMYEPLKISSSTFKQLDGRTLVNLSLPDGATIHSANLAAIIGKEDIGGYDATGIKRYFQFCQEFLGAPKDPRMITIEPQKSKFLDMLNVKHVVTSREFTLMPRKDFWIYENTFALPKAFVVSKFLVSDNDKELTIFMKSSEFDPSKQVALEKNPGLGSSENVAWSMSSFKEDINQVEIKVSSYKEAILFLSIPYHNGWSCTINGTSSEILRANFAFMAVKIPQGECKIQFVFLPRSFTVGSIITILAVIAIIICQLKLFRL